jgi:hypothetical protein
MTWWQCILASQPLPALPCGMHHIISTAIYAAYAAALPRHSPPPALPLPPQAGKTSKKKKASADDSDADSDELSDDEIDRVLEAQERMADDDLGDPSMGYDYDQLAAAMEEDGLGSGGSGDEGSAGGWWCRGWGADSFGGACLSWCWMHGVVLMPSHGAAARDAPSRLVRTV